MSSAWKAPESLVSRLERGLDRVAPELRDQQAWLVRVLATKDGLAELRSGRAEDLAALFVLRPFEIEQRAIVTELLVALHGLPAVLTAILAPPPVVLFLERRPTYDSVRHRVLGRLARSVVFCARGAASERWVPFRITEDGSFADDHDDALALGPAAEIVVYHPVRSAPAERDRLRALLLDYAILQPFEQVERATFELSREERDATVLRHFVGRRVASSRLAALLGRGGWQHEGHLSMRRRFRREEERGRPWLGIGELAVELAIEERDVHKRGTTAADRLGVLRLFDGPRAVPFSALDDVALSEVWRDLSLLPLA